MNKSTYTYSLLQYRHSQLLGEVLNIGLLAWFPQELKLAFIHPKRLNRISRVYPDVQEKIIKSYLKSFSLRVKELNLKPSAFSQLHLEDSLLQFSERELLPSDSSALQFAPSRKGIMAVSNSEEILRKLHKIYFVVYNTDAIDSQKIDDQQITSRYKSFLKEIHREWHTYMPLHANDRLQYDYELELPEGEKFKFEVAWKNGSFNLVQPMSFDLSSEEYIQAKSLRYYGQFLEMAPYAKDQNIRADLLLVRPKQKQLFKAYDNALKVLQKPGYIKFVEERELRDYSEKTILAISEQDEGATFF